MKLLFYLSLILLVGGIAGFAGVTFGGHLYYVGCTEYCGGGTTTTTTTTSTTGANNSPPSYQITSPLVVLRDASIGSVIIGAILLPVSVLEGRTHR